MVAYMNWTPTIFVAKMVFGTFPIYFFIIILWYSYDSWSFLLIFCSTLFMCARAHQPKSVEHFFSKSLIFLNGKCIISSNNLVQSSETKQNQQKKTKHFGDPSNQTPSTKNFFFIPILFPLNSIDFEMQKKSHTNNQTTKSNQIKNKIAKTFSHNNTHIYPYHLPNPQILSFSFLFPHPIIHPFYHPTIISHTSISTYIYLPSFNWNIIIIFQIYKISFRYLALSQVIKGSVEMNHHWTMQYSIFDRNTIRRMKFSHHFKFICIHNVLPLVGSWLITW